MKKNDSKAANCKCKAKVLKKAGVNPSSKREISAFDYRQKSNIKSGKKK